MRNSIATAIEFYRKELDQKHARQNQLMIRSEDVDKDKILQNGPKRIV
jgi:hypothetical protein